MGSVAPRHVVRDVVVEDRVLPLYDIPPPHAQGGYRGFPHWTAEELREIMPKLVDAGFQLHTHAMGDGSVKHTIDGYVHAQNVTGKRTRNVVAHVMLVQPEDFARMAENDIIACVQPTWTAMTKGEYATMRLALGKKRSEQLYPYGRFLKAGAMISAGTDFPVMPPPDPRNASYGNRES